MGSFEATVPKCNSEVKVPKRRYLSGSFQAEALPYRMSQLVAETHCGHPLRTPVVDTRCGHPLWTPTVVTRWQWPVKGKLIGVFSAKEQGNKGIKIAGNRGDIIKAAADGRVVYAGSALRGYGNLVIVKHSDDYLSAYAHADSILVKEKQFVNIGQTLAKMGNTGTDRVMLHFEIRHHGKSVNPMKYLPKY